MSTNLIPAEVPSYMLQASGLMSANADALSGLKVGGFPAIRLNGTRFVATEGDQEVPLPVLELPIVILRAAPGIHKTWYATRFDPNSTEAKGPDCFSTDGIAPNGAAPLKQATNCATCPMNAWGSGKSQDGSPSKGKACADAKQLAVFSGAPRKAGADSTIFGLRVPPASLKNFATYVKAITSRRLPLQGVLTVVSFDPKVTYPILEFKFGGLLNEQQFHLMQESMEGDEVRAIIESDPPVVAPLTRVEPAPAPAPEPAPAPKKAKAAPPPPPVEVDLEVEAPTAVDAPSDPEDDELARSLGLM